jgi:hypothetical protein
MIIPLRGKLGPDPPPARGIEASSSLVLVGTVHLDPRGFSKLFGVLEREAPDFLSVEISPYALTFRANRGVPLRAALRENLRNVLGENGGSLRRLLAGGEIQGIFALLQVPFEWRAAAEYARRNRVGLKPIDLCACSREKLGQLAELIEPENLRQLLKTPRPPIQLQVRRQYGRARFLWNSSSPAGSFSAEIEARERHMAGEIRRLIAGHHPQKFLHVGGWEHFMPCPSGNSLFEKLKDLNPRRLLLEEEGKGEKFEKNRIAVETRPEKAYNIIQ